jgi:hypothetical protein
MFYRCNRRFGYPNREALAEGRTGIEARGEEHEVVIVWSVTSGKRQIMMDGKEIHYSTNRIGILDHSWSTKGNHVLKVYCHAAAPMTANPNFRQYELSIDGQSFFLMPKVYELGLRGGSRGAPPPNPAYGGPSPRGFAEPAGGVHVPRNSYEEEEELQRAINASIEESKKHLERNNAPPPPSLPGGDLLSLDAGPSSPGFDNMSFTSAPPPMQYTQPPPPQYRPPPQQYSQPPQGYGQSPPPQYSQQPPATPTYPSSNAGAAAYPALPPSSSYGASPSAASYGSPPGQPTPPPAAPVAYGAPPTYAPAPPQPWSGGGDAYGRPPPPTADPLGLRNMAQDPFAPKPPTHHDIANEILSAYSATSPNSANGVGQSFDSAGTPTAGTPNGMSSNMNMMALVEVKEEEPDNPFDAALKKLVNVDHIDEPAEEQLKLTMKKKENQTKAKAQGKSRGLPPAANNMVGNQATLVQISTVKAQKDHREDIMKAPPQLFHPGASQAGMLVVHGQASPNGPPPLQPQGFGMGYQYPPQAGYR